MYFEPGSTSPWQHVPSPFARLLRQTSSVRSNVPIWSTTSVPTALHGPTAPSGWWGWCWWVPRMSTRNVCMLCTWRTFLRSSYVSPLFWKYESFIRVSISQSTCWCWFFFRPRLLLFLQSWVLPTQKLSLVDPLKGTIQRPCKSPCPLMSTQVLYYRCPIPTLGDLCTSKCLETHFPGTWWW